MLPTCGRWSNIDNDRSSGAQRGRWWRRGIKKLCGLDFEGIFSYLLESLRLMVGLIIEGRTSDVRIKVFTE